jgi:pSer/pThr/pTyr-binding forkhead associated (FHA) protein
MNPLQVQLFVGAAAGRRARFDRSPITFGRDPGNLLVVDDALVSRRHGEVRFEGGMWMLANLSENGTRVNRKNVTEKPVPLKTGDEVFVGGKLLFNVTIEPVETQPAGDQPMTLQEAGPDGEAVPKKKKKKAIMWMIPIYATLLLGLIIFLSTLKGKKGPTVEDSVPELTREQVSDMIRKPLKKEPLSELRYREALNKAMQLFNSRGTISGPYDAYRKYQEALSYSDRTDGNFPPNEPEAQLQYHLVQEEVIDKAYRTYDDACNHLKRGDFEGAYHGFDRLKNMITDGDHPLIRNAQQKQNIAWKRNGGKIKPPK